MNPTTERIPSMIQIVLAVSKAAHLTSAQIMSEQRSESIQQARAAIYDLATTHGYARQEIMDYLNRDRCVSYNIERNVNGHLATNRRYLLIIDKAKAQLSRWTPRATRRIGTAPEPTVPKAEPTFTDWKGTLGWSFTAAELRRMHYAQLNAQIFMRSYGKAHETNLRPQTQNAPDIPTEMTTNEASEFFKVSPSVLKRGYDLGHLHREKRNHCYIYQTAEIERYINSETNQ